MDELFEEGKEIERGKSRSCGWSLFVMLKILNRDFQDYSVSKNDFGGSAP